MATKKSYDGKFVSNQLHEVKYISNKFIDALGNRVPMGFIYFALHLMNVGDKKVERTKLYTILKYMGYKDSSITKHEAPKDSFLKLKKK